MIAMMMMMMMMMNDDNNNNNDRSLSCLYMSIPLFHNPFPRQPTSSVTMNWTSVAFHSVLAGRRALPCFLPILLTSHLPVIIIVIGVMGYRD